MTQNTEHRLVDNTLIVEHSEKDGKAVGVVAKCICGWRSRPHFSSFSASNAFQEHKDEQKVK